MSENTNVGEQHGCIVCGKLYSLLVVYSPEGKLVDCAVTSPGGHRVMDPNWPLVACDRHSSEEVKTALVNHYPGKAKEDQDEE